MAGGTALLGGACATVYVPRPSLADAQRVAEQWPGTTVADLEQGRSLYLARCTRCHQPFEPREFPPEQWPREVTEMMKRSKLDATEAAGITRYLVTMSTLAPGASDSGSR